MKIFEKFDSMTTDQHLKLMRHFVDADIEAAKAGIGSVCDDCLIGKFFESFPEHHREGIMIGLSMHWLRHIVKLIESEKVLSSETIE